ncbi:DNA-binding transcriptional regulator, MerR family [Modestobacter sp. DSM 44400]|uniref:heavy metal-responsive transcriptional regulator n=1 Tax=Modestobacter sp. DSM 44400 TaxID=1550230 RepID=UPI000894695E|nr:heavy metal-responsive transcriptional regulator [Modestobacter sp. DSM 44400]SDY78553.1 DNA-binding transcriptional regulator, MerR family [Modestobacter sp. DSM 44400]
MRTGELADRVGVNPKTVRYYESIGLMAQPARTAAGYRVYGPEDQARLVFIKTAQHLGLSLEEIGEVLALRAAGSPPCDHVREMLSGQVRSIGRRIAELRRLREELRALEAAIDDIPETAGPVCRIIEHTAAQQATATGGAHRRESGKRRDVQRARHAGTSA